MRSDTIHCAWERHDHDWQISGDTVCHDLFSRLDTITYVQTGSRADPDGGQGVRTPLPPPPKNHKNIGFLSNTGPDPLKIHKAAKPAFNAGTSLARQRWRFAGGPMVTRFKCFLDLLSPYQITI